MDSILGFFIEYIKLIWEKLWDFTLPWGDTRISFVQVLASLFLLTFFAKLVARFFDFSETYNEYILRHDNYKRILEKNRANDPNRLFPKISWKKYNGYIKNPNGNRANLNVRYSAMKTAKSEGVGLKASSDNRSLWRLGRRKGK